MQRTLKHSISCHGVGLHSGETIHMTLSAAGADTGIVFKRTDLDGPAAFLPATYDRISDTRLCSVLGNTYGARLGTIEHLMAALWGAGVDNAMIEVSGAEVPIMDGSSEPFLTLIEQAGLVMQDAPRRVLVIDEALEVHDGDSFARVEPHKGFILDVSIDFAHNAIGAQRAEYDFSDTSFAEALARARTFGFAEEVTQLQAAGLARGGSLDNAIVVNSDGVMNQDGLRFPDEFVRHKALDAVGDYFLCGHRLMGKITTHKPGHRLNNLLMRSLMGRTHAWHLQEALAPSEQTPSPVATPHFTGLIHAGTAGRPPMSRVLHQAEK